MANRTIETHQQWIGYLNPTGLVFSPQALEDAQVIIHEGVISEQREFSGLVTKTESEEIKFSGYANVKDIFLKTLGWRDTDLNSDQALITQYSFSHPQFNELVSPSYVSKVNAEKVILIQELDLEDFDKTANSEDTWNSSPHFKFERLLREKHVSTGILVSKEKLRLIFAPRGESSGYIDFPFKIMYQPSGRLVFSAFLSLFNATRVFDSQVGESLIEVLEKSRKYQAQVSIELSGQVLAALYELLRGFQTADDEESGELLKKTLSENPQLIYEGLLTTLLRMVFIMYAEDRNLLANDEVYQSSYSLAGLYEKLRQDEAQNPDTMDSRYGAWAHLISLFRLIYDGAEYDSEKGKVVLPARHGHLFDPNIYLFLEGRDKKEQVYSKAPKISDGVVFRVLKNLLVLNGERISYRTLDVEQIGSVYETMMGFELGKAIGETIALKPTKPHGAPLPINLDEILATKDKAKKLDEVSELKLSEKVKKEFNECKTVEEIESVLDKRIDRRATPFRLSKDAMVLVPSEARRRSGSHYTPRELTEPIVRVALEPVLKNLGDKPTPEQILDLKICDPAMGSGAFLVEACRQLSENLVESWNVHGIKVPISTDEDELLHARKLIAQKCLYGVDKNHMAVNLSKLSLWLITLAKDHSFGFLDHNLKHGDSLVGLSNKQIMGFDYMDREELPLFQYVKDQLSEAQEARDEIINATDEKLYDALKVVEDEYQERLIPMRLAGNFILNCIFTSKNEKERNKNLQTHRLVISNYFSAHAYDKMKEYCLKHTDVLYSKVVPFHWQLEFPEVFNRESSGFDCFIGNPPYAGHALIEKATFEGYTTFLKLLLRSVSGKSDLVSYFFQKTSNLCRLRGTISFVTTNTISQGDTRGSSLTDLLRRGYSIYCAEKNTSWPGIASVMVTTVHLHNGPYPFPKRIGKKAVAQISSYLVEGDFNEDPLQLKRYESLCSLGTVLRGKGFLFSTKPKKGEGSVTQLEELKKLDKDLNKYVKKYLTVGDFLDQCSPDSNKFVIDISNLTESEVKKLAVTYEYLFNTVKQERLGSEAKSLSEELKEKFWTFGHSARDLYEAISKLNECIVTPQCSKYRLFQITKTDFIFDKQIIVFSSCNYSLFSVLSSALHEIWSLFFGGTLEDRPLYSMSDCFNAFPFPNGFLENDTLIEAGRIFYNERQRILSSENVGLTELYNLFHDTDVHSESIKKLRDLHIKNDKAVLDAFGMAGLAPEYDFILDEESSSEDEKKKKYRFTIKKDCQDQILSHLLKRNLELHEEEVRLGLHKR